MKTKLSILILLAALIVAFTSCASGDAYTGSCYKKSHKAWRR